jgi:hypothetical protein
MVSSRSESSTIRYMLGGLLTFGALNAFGGGYYGLSGAKVSLLSGSREAHSVITRFRA